MKRGQTEVNVTVCQLRSDPEGLAQDWERLVTHVRQASSDLVLLPEMPFYPWPFWEKPFRSEVWEATLVAHERWQTKLEALAPAVVVGSRPVQEGGKRLNRGFTWRAGDGEGVRLAHSKYYLPDEPGFWEGSWYARGDGAFDPVLLTLEGGVPVCAGFLICSELWFMQEARRYGQAGAELLLTPRATERKTVHKWLAGGRTAAVVAGAYSLSSNHFSVDNEAVSLGGFGWVIGPDGEVLALTTPDTPFATVAIDLARAHEARHTYPRYIRD